MNKKHTHHTNKAKIPHRNYNNKTQSSLSLLLMNVEPVLWYG